MTALLLLQVLCLCSCAPKQTESLQLAQRCAAAFWQQYEAAAAKGEWEEALQNVSNCIFVTGVYRHADLTELTADYPLIDNNGTFSPKRSFARCAGDPNAAQSEKDTHMGALFRFIAQTP